jgi:hypothetical protein
MMRKVTADKFKTIADVKQTFRKRLGHLADAKDYEVRCQRHMAIEGARKLVQEYTETINKEFNKEAEVLKEQFIWMDEQTRKHEEIFAEQTRTIGLQELMISKLSKALFVRKVDNDMKKQFFKTYSSRALRDTDNKQIRPFVKDAFEFYGGNYRMSEVEKQQICGDQVYHSMQQRIQELEEQCEIHKSEI